MAQENVPSIPAPATGTTLSLWQVLNENVKTRAVCWDAKFQTAQELWDACMGYLKHVEDNPHHAPKLSTFEGQATVANEPRPRVPSLYGLYAYLGIHQKTWQRWKMPDTNTYRADLEPVMLTVEELIKDWKFSYGATGLANANLMARDLGLGEKVEMDQNLRTEKPVHIDERRIANLNHPDATVEQLDAYYAAGKQPPLYSQEQLDAGAQWIPYTE